jgi:hypothetical protein
MSEILVSQDGATSTVLPETAEEKARQVPDPATFHLLCVLPEIDESYESGIVKAGQTMHYEEVLSPVLYVVKIGPDAYKDEKRFPSVRHAKQGTLCWLDPTPVHGSRFMAKSSASSTMTRSKLWFKTPVVFPVHKE